jgi:hypothetical protein
MRVLSPPEDAFVRCVSFLPVSFLPFSEPIRDPA